ncbi:MAG: ATP-dependent Clp protease proteolytic subunit [Phycisphaerales bacterium]|nr:ATP-dependent Clp protease proteolytic subunit [Phycisphaerales bacterium]
MSLINQRVPFVIESSGRGDREMDIFSRLLKDRIVFLTGGVDDEVANLIIAQLLFLSNEDPKADVHLYVNSPGGSVSAGLAIYDTMQYLRCDVATYCIGMAASMGAVILCGGTKNKRFLLPNSRVLLHQPLLGGIMEGSATDLAIESEEIIRLRKVLYDIIAIRSGQSYEKVQKDCDRNKWLSAKEATEYGIADTILERMPK